jgi:hypothetical protein
MMQQSTGLVNLNAPISGSRSKTSQILISLQVLSVPVELDPAVHVLQLREQVCWIRHHGQKSHLPYFISDFRDEQWLSKLRGLGMSGDDEWKLANLRQHIWKVAQLQTR